MNYHFLGPLCSSRVEYARPRRLLNVEMQWRVIVNDGQKLQQTVRLETCLKVKRIMVTIKGQLISKCPYEKSVLSKIPTKKFPRFLF